MVTNYAIDQSISLLDIAAVSRGKGNLINDKTIVTIAPDSSKKTRVTERLYLSLASKSYITNKKTRQYIE